MAFTTATGYGNLPNGNAEFTIQEKMKLENFIDSVQNVQITDLDESGYTDLLITSDETSYWLHTKLLKNKISFPVEDSFVMAIFADDSNSDVQFYSVNADQKIKFSKSLQVANNNISKVG